MFTRSDLSTLLAEAPAIGVSMFLPTHVRGAEIRQDPIRLKNLVTQARTTLLATGIPHAQAETFLAPAMALVQDFQFWQHQHQGLALFLDPARARTFQVPIPLGERVVVGPGFHITPLLAVLAADGPFHLLTITEERVRLFNATRFTMIEDTAADLPRSLSEDQWDSDYEDPVQASPSARPHTGAVSISNAQVFGDGPPEWRKSRLVEFTRRVASGIERHLAAGSTPVVLVANPEIAGHFQKLTTLGPQLIGVLEADPEAMSSAELHDSGYVLMRPHLDAGRREAGERFMSLGGNDPRAATAIDDVARAAYQGRIDTLLLAEDETVWGRYDEEADRVHTGAQFAATGEELLNAVAVETLKHGGTVHMLAREDMAGGGAAAAILRY